MSTADRRVLLALALARGERLTTARIRSKYGVSAATAKRDLVALETLLPVKVVERTGRSTKELAL